MIVPEIKFLPTDFMDPLDFISTVKSMIVGDISDVIDNIVDYLVCFDISLYYIKDGEPVVANYLVSFSDILDLLEKVIGILTIASSIILELCTGVGFITLAQKIFTLIMDYVFEWLPLPDPAKDFLRNLVGIVNLVDPPGDFIYVQIYNESGHLVLGHDYESGEYINSSKHGFMFIDEDRCMFVLDGNYSQYRIVVGRESSRAVSDYLTYSLIVSAPLLNKTIVSGGALYSGEQTDVLVSYTSENVLLNELHAYVSPPYCEVVEGDEALIYVNVTDANGAEVLGAEVIIEMDGVFYTADELGNGMYSVVIPTRGLFGVYCLNVYVKKEGYCPGKKTMVLKVYDITPPEIYVINPQNSSVVRGTIRIVFSVYEEHIYIVNVSMNETMIGSFESNGTITIDLDTEMYTDGVYVIKIVAMDRHNNIDVKTIIIIIDNTPPIIANVEVGSLYRESEEIGVVAYVDDETSGVSIVYLWYRRNNGSWVKITMTYDGEKWVATIPKQPCGAIVELYIEAYDRAGNKAQSQIYKFKITMSYTKLILIVTAIAVAAATMIYYTNKRYNIFQKIKKKKATCQFLAPRLYLSLFAL